MSRENGDADVEDTVDLSEVTGDDEDAERGGRGERTERTVSPGRVDATLQDGRVSIEATTRTASLTARTTRHTPLSETEPVVYLSLVDGDAVDVDCDVCGRRFDGRDALVDHLEDAHALISTTVERNARLVFDAGGDEDGDDENGETRRSRRRDGRAPGDRS